MGKTNAAWHAAYRMPSRTTLAQRVEWHIAHAATCACRQMPDPIKAQVARRAALKAARGDHVRQRWSVPQCRE